MPANLIELSYELDDFVFGSGTPYIVQDVAYGSPEVVHHDKPMPRADGVRFGRDYRGGRVITFDIVIDPPYPAHGNSVDALDLLAQLENKWLANSVRSTPGRTSLLRLSRGGRTRRLYGRPRRFETLSERSKSGWVFATCDFQAIDHQFYGDGEFSNTVTIIPPDGGGLMAPLASPLSTVPVSYEPGIIDVEGDTDAWMVFVIRGPIVNPEVRVVDHWTLKLNHTLHSGQTIGIDPRPWSRGIRQDATNRAGTLDWQSPRLSEVKLAPGRYEVVLAGQDITGTASLTVAWRNSYVAY